LRDVGRVEPGYPRGQQGDDDSELKDVYRLVPSQDPKARSAPADLSSVVDPIALTVHGEQP